MPNPFEKYLKPEDRLHIAVCNYLAHQYPGCSIHHSPNEGKRTLYQQWLIRMLRVSPGFPDLLLIYKYKMIIIELKAGKNKATPGQKSWIDLLKASGVPSAICTGFDETKDFIDSQFS